MANVDRRMINIEYVRPMDSHGLPPLQGWMFWVNLFPGVTDGLRPS